MPAPDRHQEPCRIGVATPDRTKQPAGTQRVSCDEPEPELQASSPQPPVVVERPRAPRLRQQLDRLIDEPVVCRSDPFERGEQLLVGASRAAQRNGVEDRVHRSAQVAVAAEQLIELLLVDRRELIRCDRGRGLETLEKAINLARADTR
jgi:hypothetical protein